MRLNRKLLKSWKSKPILWQIILLIIGGFSLFSLVIILHINLIAEKTMEGNLIIDQRNELNNQVEYINNQFKQLELFSINWGERIKQDLEKIVKAEEDLTYENTQVLRSNLISLEVGNLLIQEAFIYIDTKVPYSIKTGENWREHNNQQDRFFFKNFDKSNKSSWKRIETDNESKLIFSYRLSNQNDKVQKNLIIVLNNQELKNLINFTEDNLEESIILKNNSYIFASSQKIVDHLKKVTEIIKKEDNIVEIEGNDWIFYKREAVLFSETWIYLVFIPLNNITGSYSDIFSHIILWVLLGIVIISILISIGVRHIYSPIQELFSRFKRSDNTFHELQEQSDIEYIISRCKSIEDKKTELEKRLNDSNQLLVENLLKQLIQSEQIDENSFIENKIKELGWKLENKKVILVNFLLTDMVRKDSNLSEDIILSYTLSEKTIRENFSQTYKDTNSNLTVMTQKGILSILVIDNEKYIVEREKLINLTHNILKQINHIVERNMVIIVSKELDNCSQIVTTYKKIIDFRSMRKCKDTNIVLDMKQIYKSTSKDVYSYPIEFEKDIIQGIHLNDEKVILKGLDNFEKSIKAQQVTINQMRSAFLQVLNNLRYEIIHMGYGSEQIIGSINNCFINLNSTEWIEQAKCLTWNDFLKPLLDDKKENNTGEEKNYINKVLYLIRNHYQEESFSLEWCADQVEIDEFVLSKIFKKNMGINFIDYLTKTRLDKAMELLVTTNYPITTIAQMVGYQSNYFSRIFKAKVGKTPGEYRKEK